MSNFKKITELPVAESTENINLIVSEDGVAKQIPANQVGAQADWNETDEASPSFIMNKPDSIGGGSLVLYFTSDSLYYDESKTQKVYGEEFRDLVLNNRILLTESSYSYGIITNFYFSSSNVNITCIDYGEPREFTVWDKEI